MVWRTAEVEQVFVLEPWIRAAPFADDHLRAKKVDVVLRVAQGRVTSESGPSVCEREQNPNAEDWRWDFGDGTVARGSEVIVYPRDGIYSVTVTGGTQSQPIESVIEVLIVNVAPDFITEPPEDAEGGETYFYTVELQDQGLEDEIRLELTQAPAGMNLTPLGGRKWQLLGCASAPDGLELPPPMVAPLMAPGARWWANNSTISNDVVQ